MYKALYGFYFGRSFMPHNAEFIFTEYAFHVTEPSAVLKPSSLRCVGNGVLGVSPNKRSKG